MSFIYFVYCNNLNAAVSVLLSLFFGYNNFLSDSLEKAGSKSTDSFESLKAVRKLGATIARS